MTPTATSAATGDRDSNLSLPMKYQLRRCGAPGDRTLNPRVKSPLLCQLS